MDVKDYQMYRLDILAGIGLMLMGSLAYAIPAVQDFPSLYSAFCGIVIATGGFIGMNHGGIGIYIRYLNAAVAAVALIWLGLKVVPDARIGLFPSVQFMADIDAIGLCVIPVWLAIRDFVALRLRLLRERENRKPWSER